MRVVLPDLPNHILSPELKKEYHIHIPILRQIRTIAACEYSSIDDLQAYLQRLVQPKKSRDDDDSSFQSAVIHFLVVGGNHRRKSEQHHKGRLTTIDVIRYLSSSSSSSFQSYNPHHHHQHNYKVWGVTNPNCFSSIHRVHDKINAGATGFITQPLWSQHAFDIIRQYPTTNTTTESKKIHYVAGMAFPTSVRSLHFWNRLIMDHSDNDDDNYNNNINNVVSKSSSSSSTTLVGDSVFDSYFRYFANIDHDSSSAHAGTKQWAIQHHQQLMELVSTGVLSGIHYMPLHNVHDLMVVLQQQQQQQNEAS